MQLPRDATVAVVDGEKFNLFRNAGDEAGLKLVAASHDESERHHKGAGAGRHGSSANPDGAQDAEDGFSERVAQFLNKSVLEGKIGRLLVIAAPRTLGALRKQYHDKTSSALLGEVPKDLTGHSMADVEKAVIAA
jgi:protein required for attachment to host cells